jgi:hypothetical protein
MAGETLAGLQVLLYCGRVHLHAFLVPADHQVRVDAFHHGATCLFPFHPSLFPAK